MRLAGMDGVGLKKFVFSVSLTEKNERKKRFGITCMPGKKSIPLQKLNRESADVSDVINYYCPSTILVGQTHIHTRALCSWNPT